MTKFKKTLYRDDGALGFKPITRIKFNYLTLQGENRVSLDIPASLSTSSAILLNLPSRSYTT